MEKSAYFNMVTRPHCSCVKGGCSIDGLITAHQQLPEKTPFSDHCQKQDNGIILHCLQIYRQESLICDINRHQSDKSE